MDCIGLCIVCDCGVGVDCCLVYIMCIKGYLVCSGDFGCWYYVNVGVDDDVVVIYY